MLRGIGTTASKKLGLYRSLTMQALRIHPAASRDEPYSVTNPAPASALRSDTIDTPKPSNPDEIVVRVNATTVIRDTLTWPEMYTHPYTIPGHDFSGTVHSVHGEDKSNVKHPFRVGDEVYGMVHADRGQCWAQYVLVKAGECAPKPKNLSWEEAATVPLSALTAWQALFHHGGIQQPSSLGQAGTAASKSGSSTESEPRKVFITGASGGVGIWLVQLAKLAGCHVVAGTTSKSRSEKFLIELGADEVVEYNEVFYGTSPSSYDTIIDGVAGEVLEKCWSVVRDDGYLISIHSDSFEFVEQHWKSGIASGKDGVKASFFIVESSGADLAVLSQLIEEGRLRTFVGGCYPLAEFKAAIDLCQGKAGTQGKIVLLPNVDK